MSGIYHNIVAVMLAGGQGSRLFELTEDMCKPAVSIAGGRRIVDWTMANLADCAPAHVVVATQYRPDALINHLNTRWREAFASGTLHIRHGAAVTGQPEGYVGTADAVTRNLTEIMATMPDHVLVMAADHVYRMDYAAMIAAHQASGLPVTVAVDRVPLIQSRAFGVISVDETGRVVEFNEKPHHPKPTATDADRALVSMGIYVLDAGWLRDTIVADNEAPMSSHDVGHDILPTAV
ncbi:MAG: sugar phosphate nucleotidyltransferase, partial [Rhodobacterales bacterium]